MNAVSQTDHTVRSVADFVARLQETKGNGRRLFRGQNTDQSLLPRIMRLAKEKNIAPSELENIERKMLDRFRREAVLMLPTARELPSWQLLSIAQHHGMPTRLLDWTSNALAALWFAVSTDPPNSENHGVVWVLNVPFDSIKTPGDNDDIFLPKQTHLFQPFHYDNRIVTQSGWFSVYRHNRTNFLPLEKLKQYRGRLKRFTIPGGRFESLRQELRLLGISQASMFPDLSGLGADIQAEYIDSWRALRTI